MNDNDLDKNNQFRFIWIDNSRITHEEMVHLLQVFGDLLPDPMSERVNLDEYATKWLKYADILLVYEKEQVVGIKVLYANDQRTKHAHGLLISVLPSHQGMGIAQKMYNETFQLAKQRGMTHIFYYVHYENHRMIKLNEFLGFKKVGFITPKIEMCLELN